MGWLATVVTGVFSLVSMSTVSLKKSREGNIFPPVAEFSRPTNCFASPYYSQTTRSLSCLLCLGHGDSGRW